MILPYG